MLEFILADTTTARNIEASLNTAINNTQTYQKTLGNIKL